VPPSLPGRDPEVNPDSPKGAQTPPLTLPEQQATDFPFGKQVELTIE